MAQLSEAQRKQIAAKLRKHLSSEWVPNDLSKFEWDTVVGIFDDGMQAAEASILNSVGPQAKAWLIAHQDIARKLLAFLAEKRAEVLGG